MKVKGRPSLRRFDRTMRRIREIVPACPRSSSSTIYGIRSTSKLIRHGFDVKGVQS
jgi:hypothetical protein